MKLLREELSGVRQQTSARRQSELYPAMQDFSSSQDVNPHGKALNPNIPKFFEFVTCHRLWNLWEPIQVFFEQTLHYHLDFWTRLWSSVLSFEIYCTTRGSPPVFLSYQNQQLWKKCAVFFFSFHLWWQTTGRNFYLQNLWIKITGSLLCHVFVSFIEEDCPPSIELPIPKHYSEFCVSAPLLGILRAWACCRQIFLGFYHHFAFLNVTCIINTDESLWARFDINIKF
jgi:hypothetical protein